MDFVPADPGSQTSDLLTMNGGYAHRVYIRTEVGL